MFDWQVEIRNRVETFARSVGKSLAKQIGFGYDGMVFKTDRNTAIKGFKHEQLYRNERDVYARIDEYDMYEVRGCSVPHVYASNDESWCIEMEIVSPPFVLDFAGAYLNFPPEYPDDVMETWRAEKREQYEDDWPWVQEIMSDLASIGVYLADVKPGNITLR
ncbi:MAG: hypothetical protein KDA52_08760 [Planctomycetaceae bacterium]|nr:hypothetical protein [Planctomycetaceae bacterium]